MQRDNLAMVLLLVAGLTLHVVGGLLSIPFGGRPDGLVDILLTPRALFGAATAAFPLGAHLGVGASLLARVKGRPAVRWAVYADCAVALGLGLQAQIKAWSLLHTDAQGGLFFIFAPLYAGVFAGLVGLGLVAVAFLGDWIWRRVGRRPLQGR